MELQSCSTCSHRSLFFRDRVIALPACTQGPRLRRRFQVAAPLACHGPATRSSALLSDSVTSRGVLKFRHQDGAVLQKAVVEDRAVVDDVEAMKTIHAGLDPDFHIEVSRRDHRTVPTKATTSTLPKPDDVKASSADQRLRFLRPTIMKKPQVVDSNETCSSQILPHASTEISKSPVQRMISAVCDKLESLIPLIEPRERSPRVDPLFQMEGNFAPVDESPPQEVLEVRGSIPACFNGAYIRNGGNPRFTPTAGYHYFDGDGMLHVVRIKDGVATHCCRFTRTNRLLHEDREGRAIFSKAMGELGGLAGIARLAIFFVRTVSGLTDYSKGIGSANAGLEFFNGMLLAMSEDDMPYAVRVMEDGNVETLGRYNFGGSLKSAMTAHPKINPETGEMFSFSYNILKQPYLTYFRVAPNGTKEEEVPITMPEPTIMHDFAVTENYSIFLDGQIVFRFQELLKGKPPIACDEKKVSRFGVLPRNDTSEARMRWFELPDVTCFHFVNAWEEGDEILLVGSAMAPLHFIFDHPSDLICCLSIFRLNLRTGKACKQPASNANLDIGRCNPLYSGRKIRYVYMSTWGPWPKFSGVAKVDLESFNGADSSIEDSSIVGLREFGRGCFGSEPYFVPKSRDVGADVAEDDEYVVTHYHNENTGVSELLIMDAQSPTLEIVASLKLPWRVPYGFHGTFLTEEQLALQRSALP